MGEHLRVVVLLFYLTSVQRNSGVEFFSSLLGFLPRRISWQRVLVEPGQQCGVLAVAAATVGPPLALLDCHGNWTAAMAIMDRNGLDAPQCTVTAQYEVKLKRPTPLGPTLKLQSRVLGLQDDRAEVIIELKADEKTCATGRGLFVAVEEGHPAYHRWH